MKMVPPPPTAGRQHGLKTSVAGEAGEGKELDVLLQAARPREGSEDIRLERSLSTIRLICDKSLGISDS